MKNIYQIKTLLLAIIAVLVLTTIILSCKKEKNAGLILADATVVASGPIAYDGCGWLIKIDTAYYSPVNLPDKFKVNNAPVSVGYYLLETKFQCGLAAYSLYNQINIKDIKSR